MPQGRIILKAICQSKKLASLKTDGARLLYTWLIPNVDINGCFSGEVDVVKGQVFTRLKKSSKTVEAYLQNLHEERLIVLYSSNGDRFLCIPDFADKQPSLNPSREAEPTIKPPTPEQLRTCSGSTPREVKESKVKQSKIKVKEKQIFPQILDTSEFHNSWEEWKQHRTEIKKKLTPSTITKQLKMLSKYPVATAIATIERSIEKGWTGLFPDKEQNNGRKAIPQNQRETPEQQSAGVLGGDFGDQKSEYGTEIKV